MKIFLPSENKNRLRRIIDTPLVEAERKHHGHPLTYFGLPGEGLFDVLDWNHCLSTICAVEKGDSYDPSRKQALLVANAIQHSLVGRFVLFRGEINDVIVNGQDGAGTKLRFPFEICNFDYGGSLLYKDRVRIDTLELFVREQRPTDFLLLITTNVREYDEKELDETLARIRQEIAQHGSKARETWYEGYVAWLKTNSRFSRQAIHLMYLVKNLAEINKYHVHVNSPIWYLGSKDTVLLHYSFVFRSVAGASTKVVSPQSIIDLMLIPIRELKENDVVTFERGPVLPS